MKLNTDELAQAKALADAMEVQIAFKGVRPGHLVCVVGDAHVMSAAMTAKLLLTAAYSHRGDDASFVEMALQALAAIRGAPPETVEPQPKASDLMH